MAGSHNWQQFDATQTNMMNDADYAASSYRTNGVTGGIAPSATHNKMFFQWSVMAYAIAQCLADAGQAILDSSPTGLIAALKQVWGGLTGITAQTASFAAHLADKGKYFPCSGAAITITPDAAATLGANWYIDFSNKSAALSGFNVTIAATVDGTASPVFGPGSRGRLMCDGTAFYFLGRQNYESAQQTITAAGSLTLTHNLIASPRNLKLSLICLTAEGGYSIGDEAEFPVDTAVANGGIAVVRGATTIFIRYGQTVPGLTNKTTGNAFSITAADWALILRASN